MAVKDLTPEQFVHLMSERRAASFSKLVTMLHAGAENSWIVTELRTQIDEIRKYEITLEKRLIE